MPSISSVSFSLAVLAAGYAQVLCITAPHHARSKHHTDRIRFLTGDLTVFSRFLVSLATIYQALIALFYADEDRTIVNQFCPYPEYLNETRLSWSGRTAFYLALMALGTCIRLAAYGGLGRNFTFALATPDRLVTTGIYQYLQHPSYTGLILVSGGYTGLMVRHWDAAVTCFIPGVIVKGLREWELVMTSVGFLVGLVGLRVRVKDEEKMLRERFGREWEDWHQRTARLIPGVF